MKRLTAIFLAALMMLSAFTVGISAVERSKLSGELKQELDTLSDDETVCVWIWTEIAGDFNSSFELMEYADRLARQECGLSAGSCRTMEEVDLYSKTYNRILLELETANVMTVIEKLGLREEEIICRGCNLLILNLTKEQVYAAEALDEVALIELSDGGVPVEPELIEDPDDQAGEYNLDPDYYIADEDDLIDAVIRSYGDLYITREMVYIVNRAPVAQGIYVVSYTIEVEPYHDCGDYAVGHYTLTVTDDSMPVIYSVGDREICSFAEAWEKGLIANRRICRNIEALEWVSFSKNLLIGDVDDDDRITVLDATMIQRGLSGLLGEDYRFSACADADGDGMVTILDATRIQRYKAQLCSLDGTVPYGAQEESA